VIYDKGSKITRDYGITGVPTVIIADRTGAILFRNHYVPNEVEINKLLH